MYCDHWRNGSNSIATFPPSRPFQQPFLRWTWVGWLPSWLSSCKLFWKKTIRRQFKQMYMGRMPDTLPPSCHPTSSVKALKVKGNGTTLQWPIYDNSQTSSSFHPKVSSIPSVLELILSHCRRSHGRQTYTISTVTMSLLTSPAELERKAVYIYFIMADLWNRSRAGHYIFVVSSIFFFLSSFFSSPILSRHRLDVYHTSTHGVALVRI